MARLTAAERKSIPKGEYGVPSKAPGPGSYPMPDRAHAANAKARAAQFASPKVRAEVDRKANAVLGHAGKQHDGSPAHHMATRHHEGAPKETSHGGMPESLHGKGMPLGKHHDVHGFRRHPEK